jgi:hypothetical protein
MSVVRVTAAKISRIWDGPNAMRLKSTVPLSREIRLLSRLTTSHVEDV